MIVDHQGFMITPKQSTWRPRQGQWVLFKLRDPNKLIALAEQGAHTARDGSLVAIFQDHRIAPLVTTAIHEDGRREVIHGIHALRADAKVLHEGGESIPPMLMLVDANGNNLAMGVRDKATGHVEVQTIFFHWDSPNIIDAKPLDNLADMPPGRAVDPNWKP